MNQLYLRTASDTVSCCHHKVFMNQSASTVWVGTAFQHHGNLSESKALGQWKSQQSPGILVIDFKFHFFTYTYIHSWQHFWWIKCWLVYFIYLPWPAVGDSIYATHNSTIEPRNDGLTTARQGRYACNFKIVPIVMNLNIILWTILDKETAVLLFNEVKGGTCFQPWWVKAQSRGCSHVCDKLTKRLKSRQNINV